MMRSYVDKLQEMFDGAVRDLQQFSVQQQRVGGFCVVLTVQV